MRAASLPLRSSRNCAQTVGWGLAPAAFVSELLFLTPSVREVSPNGDERRFEQSKNSPSRLTPTAPSPRGLKKIADFTLAADKNRPNGNLFGLFSSFNSRKKDGCAGFFTPQRAARQSCRGSEKRCRIVERRFYAVFPYGRSGFRR